MSLRSELSTSTGERINEVKPVLVLGLGNILLSDEGVGVRVVERLQQHYHLPTSVELLDGGTTGIGLMDEIANREQLIVIDAVNAGKPPGSIIQLRNQDLLSLSQRRMSPHQLALSDVIAMLAIDDMEPRNMTVLAIEPADLSTGIGLSEIIAAQVPNLVHMVLVELEAIGYLGMYSYLSTSRRLH